MNTKRILIIEDDRDAANVLEAYLRRENFGVILAHDGKAGLEAALTQHPALILLDIMLPGMTGTEILSRLRRESDVPVIMVTAMGEAPDRIGALRFGADDYVVKPYHPGEVVARVQAVLRRGAAAHASAENYRRVGAVELNRDTMSVAVIHDENRCVATSTHALAFFQRKLAVGSGLVVANTQLLLEVFTGMVATRQRTRQVGTDRNLVLAEWLQIVHVVERGNFVSRNRRHTKVIGHAFDSFRRQPAKFFLSMSETGHDRRLFLVGGVLGDLASEFIEGVCGKHQRSISPKTISWEPMIVTTSASMWPRTISSIPAR